ncbi:espin-like protein, partial [Silurus meridionalis]
MVLHKAIAAARVGDLDTLKQLFTNGNLTAAIVDAHGAGPVHHAARCGQLHCLRFLVVEAGLLANGKALNGATPVHDAAATGHTRELQWLVQYAGCSVQEQDDAGTTTLHLAARFGRIEVVGWLLASGGRAEGETNCGAIPAHYAAARGELTCLKLLIGKAPECANRQTFMGATPLYLACQEGHLHVVEYLVKDCGADVNLRAQDGMTPLHAAAHMGHYPLVVWLASFTDISLSSQDNEGASALHFAASGGHCRILERLLRTGSKVIKDDWGGTPLHDAAENGEMECCKILLSHGVSPSERDVDGFTAADLAEYNGHYECARYLRSVETDVRMTVFYLIYFLSIRSFRHFSWSIHLRELKERLFIHKQEQPKCSRTVMKCPHLSCSVHASQRSLHHCAFLKYPDPSKPFTVKVDTSEKCLEAVSLQKMVVLPTEEANLSDIDYLVPTLDEKGRPIAEWKRQVMVRQLQARLLNDEAQRRKENGNRYAKMDSWRYSQAHNAILGPFGEMLTEDDLIYLEKQIKSVSMQKNCKGYEMELARLVEELRNILPAPIVNITVNTQYRNSNTQVKLPLWCNRISGIVMSMSLLMTNLTDESTSKMPNSELVTVFSESLERQNSSRGRRAEIENEILEFGVSVSNLKSNFENNCPPVPEDSESTELCVQEEKAPESALIRPSDNDEPAEVEQNDSGRDNEELTNVMESTSLRKERIVVLFLGHWKRSAYAVTLKNAQRKLSLDSVEMPEKSQVHRKSSLDISPKKMIEQGSLGQFLKQRSTINKMIGNWRSMISIVPSRQIRRLNRQQALYSPEQFLPRMNGAAFEYDSLTLDLFMLGYFHILEQDLSADERKMRHLLCFEVFDHLGHYSWETVRDFHKAVIQDIEAGNREWKDGFEDIKIKFFSEVPPQVKSLEKSPQAEIRPVPKVIIQTPTPDENDTIMRSADFTSLTNEEICKYIDRSFAFWKEKEAEIFDFE